MNCQKGEKTVTLSYHDKVLKCYMKLTKEQPICMETIQHIQDSHFKYEDSETKATFCFINRFFLSHSTFSRVMRCLNTKVLIKNHNNYQRVR